MATRERKPLPFAATFTAGAIAGISEILTFYPLDVVKTRMQLSVGTDKLGLLGTFKGIIAKEGPGRLYRGLVPPLLMEAPKRAIKFAANDFWGKTFLQFSGRKKMDQQLAILTGCSAGATESFVVVPFELVKIRLQDKASTYAGPIDVVRKIVQQQGLLGMYSGMESTFWRHVWWNGGFFGSIYQVRAVLPKPQSKSGEMLNNFVSGSIGGFVGTLLNTPFDVVKSRIQSVQVVPGVKPKYSWTYPAVLTVYREEGMAALYKGFVPKVLRLGPGGGVLLLVVEGTLAAFRKALGPPYE